MKLSDCKKGVYVKFTDREHRSYRELKDYVGVVEKVDTQARLSPPFRIAQIRWYADESLEDARHIEEFYLHRLTLYVPETDPKRTSLEKKCRKLWNNSKYVQNNPTLAY